MFLKKSTLTFFILNWFILSSGFGISSYFRFRDDLNDVKFQHAFLLQTPIQTVSECANLCLSLVRCASFQIHEQLMLCRFYWTHFLLDVIGIPSTGWKTFSETGPCQLGYFYTRHFHYCFRYAGSNFRKSTSVQICNERNDTLIKVDSTEENLFVSSLAYSFVNNSLGSKSFELILDGEKMTSGQWTSLFGNQEALVFTNFYAGDVATVGERIVIMPNSNGELQEYEWKSVSLNSNYRTVFCRYYP